MQHSQYDNPWPVHYEPIDLPVTVQITQNVTPDILAAYRRYNGERIALVIRLQGMKIACKMILISVHANEDNTQVRMNAFIVSGNGGDYVRESTRQSI